ncbi:portal protein [Bordetella parapertussis]|uniref:Phage head-tail connector protein n=1 Tax=Bordetella parapertussis (strain Bpp5) TaxID=1208660 RepID=K0M8R9_BORPB|nr:portal protein [Bordetella parapertussis]CCJ48963.1 Phage head-tail connector protein [Bordetella parapertussis Bpp5]
MAEQTERKLLLSRWGQLRTERESWMSHWKEISDYLLPRAGRFFVDDRNRGDKRHNNIYDSTGTRALRVLAAGMMAGMTSPARPWFRLTTSDPQLDESAAVKAWLADVTRLMQMVFAKSNTYRALHSMYEELGAFGTAGAIVLADFNSVIHHYTLTTGEFAMAADHRGQINTLYREFQMTVAQMVREFGRDNCSPTVQTLFDRGALEQWVTIMHAIEPRVDRDVTKRDDRNMAWKSVYFEHGGNEDQILRDSGFKEFPALCPRWATSGGDIYGNSPAMEALGDIKQLQHEQLRKAQGIDYKTKPPLQAPTSLKSRDVDTLPGGISFVDSAAPNGGIRSAFEVNIDLSHLLADIQDVRERIKGSFYADLFLMFANGTNPQMTATEVAERHEEKLLMLGPVLERMHNEILDPLIEMTFSRMVEANIVPPPPDELQGMELNVEFVSMLAQAQRAIATNSVDRFVGNLGAVAGIKPEVLDKFDADRWADAYADMLGIDPELIVPGEQVALIRKQRAEAAQAQQQAALLNQGADTAQKLGSVDTSKQSALTDVTRAFSGYT